jgi:hypothetical protein
LTAAWPEVLHSIKIDWGLTFTPNDPSISLGMDVDFAATKSHIMSKETPKMKKAFMKQCTDVEGSFISLSFKIPRT